jgi:Protein of unknown function (DUF3631)
MTGDENEADRAQLALLCGLHDVLADIVAELNRFLVMREHEPQITALWIVHTHVFHHQSEGESGATRHIFDHTPRLIVWSQTHGSGKTTLAEIITKLAANTESISSLTGGELQTFLRKQAETHADPVTFICDEAEQYRHTPLLLRLMNAGHRHDGYIWDGKGGRASIFAPLALFRRFDPRGDPALKPTVSRSVLVEMQKRDPTKPEHQREEFRARNPHVQRLPALRQQIATAVQQRFPDLWSWRPENDFLKGNRNADNWEPLVAIADLAGATGRRLRGRRQRTQLRSCKHGRALRRRIAIGSRGRDFGPQGRRVRSGK